LDLSIRGIRKRAIVRLPILTEKNS
jgi:hypothetical protein